MAGIPSPAAVALNTLRGGTTMEVLHTLENALQLSLALWQDSAKAAITPKIEGMFYNVRTLRQCLELGLVRSYYSSFIRLNVNVESLKECFRSRAGVEAAEMRRVAFSSFATLMLESKAALIVAQAILAEATAQLPDPAYFELQRESAQQEEAAAAKEAHDGPLSMYT